MAVHIGNAVEKTLPFGIRTLVYETAVPGGYAVAVTVPDVRDGDEYWLEVLYHTPIEGSGGRTEVEKYVNRRMDRAKMHQDGAENSGFVPFRYVHRMEVYVTKSGDAENSRSDTVITCKVNADL